MKKILALALAVLMIVPLVSCKKNKNPAPAEPNNAPDAPTGPSFDIFSEDLSAYIEVAEQLYKGLNVEVLINTVTDEDVEDVITSVLKDCRVQSVNGDEPIAEGDIVYIFYTGYLMEDGERIQFTSNSSNGPSSLEIGSGSFIPGFESNMIGKIPAEYNAENPMLIDATFPESYPQNPDLAGKNACFEVTVEIKEEKYSFYKVPELTAELITETLGFTEEHLSAYEGETTVDKYRAYLRESMEWKGIDISYFVESAFRHSVVSGATVNKYPEELIEWYCNEKIAELESAYEEYGKSFWNTFDQYVCSQRELPYGSDWRADLRKDAEIEIKYQLAIYHVMNLEQIKPSAEEYAELFIDYLDSELEKSGINPETFNQYTEYEAHREQYRAKMTLKHGDNYFKEMIYKQLLINLIASYSNIIEITE